MSQSETQQEGNDDLVKLRGYIEQLDACTSCSTKKIDADEINGILKALRDRLTNNAIRTRLASNRQIKEQQVPELFTRFCQISIRLAPFLADLPLSIDVLFRLWNIFCSKLGKLLKESVLSTREYHTIAMTGLSTAPFSTFFTNNTGNEVIQLYATLFVSLARITIWADSRRMETLTVTAYTSHQPLHETKYDGALKNLMTFVDSFLLKQQTSALEIDITRSVFSLFVAASDSKSYLPTMIRLGLARKLVEWSHFFNSRSEDPNLLEALIVTMSNVSQMEDGIVALNQAGAIAALEASEKTLANTLQEFPSIHAFYPRIYAMIATTEQLKKLPVLTSAMDYLLNLTHEANASENLRSETAHLYEYLVPLAKLLVNDSMANYLLNHEKLGGLPFFVELFHKHNHLSANDLFVKHLVRLALYNIMCSLAFHATVQQALKQNQAFIDAVKETSKTTVGDATIPPSLRNGLLTAKTAAEGILVYLDQFKTVAARRSDAAAGETAKIPMISYSHKDAAFCRAVVKGLKEHSISVWVDEDGHCLSDDCWEEIAMAIRNASVVLIVVSEDYCTKSDACRLEATYAVKLKIPVIALYIDDKYQAEPWLDIHLTGLHVKFGKKPFDERIARLAKFITARSTAPDAGERAPSVAGQLGHEVRVADPDKPKDDRLTSTAPDKPLKSSAPKTPPSSWSAADVRSWWCDERTLIPQLCTFCDGEALCVYAKLFLSSYEENSAKHCQQLRDRLAREHHVEFYDDQYANLVSSMKWIIQHKEGQGSKPTKSSTCTLL